MIISTAVESTILNDALNDLNSAAFYTITYSSVKSLKSKKICMKLTSGSSIVTGFKKKDACVYAIYEYGKTDPVYVGSSLDVNKRLKEHLLSNKWALSDYTYIKKNGRIPLRSKLANVYNLVKGMTTPQIQYKVISVSPDEYYTAVESLLIKYFNLKSVGWNKRK